MKVLTEKQETFCRIYYETGNACEAFRQAGYARKHIYSNVYEVVHSPTIQQRLKELKEKEDKLIEELTNHAVMGVAERKMRLTEIARARLTDFMELGQDGSWVNIGPESEKSAAIQEIHSRTEYDEKTSKGTVYTSVKLHNPLNAIDLLNKMEKMYSDGYQDNRVLTRIVNVFVVDNETKELIARVSERTVQIGNANDQGIQGSPEGMGGGKEANQT